MTDDEQRDDPPQTLGDHPIRTRALCGAKTRAGTPCRGWAMKNGRCRMHSGGALAGIASPTFKTGRYSKAMPISLREGYERGRSDPELLSLVDEIALVQGRLRQLIARLESDNGPIVRRADIVRTWTALKNASKRRDPVAVAAAIDAHGAAIEAATAHEEADSAVWVEIRETTRLAAQLMAQEAQRRIAMGDLVNTEVTLTLFAELVMIVRSEISDADVLRRIQAGMEAVIDGDRVSGRLGG